MEKQRQMEIALMIVEQKVAHSGIPGVDTLEREMGNMAQKLDLTVEELMQLYESLMPKIIARTFGYSEVSITANGKKR